MKTDLSRINLNLLVAFDALLKEKHVTRAGQRLHITQSAMSNILKQLRDTFKDQLFIRGQASRMIPTPRALELTESVTEVLEKASNIFFKPEIFNAAEAAETFTLGLSDYAEFIILPPLIQYITKHAPGIDIVVKHLNYINDEKAFENSEIDAAIGLYPKIPERLIAETLFTEQAVSLGWKKNPLLQQPMTLQQFAKAEQIVILYYESSEQTIADQSVKKIGLKRRAVATVPHTIAAIYSLPNTHLICNVLERVAKKFTKHLPLAMQPIPFPYLPMKVDMVWHPKNRNAAVHQWLRETIRALAKKV